MAFLGPEALGGWLWERLQGAGFRDFGVVEAAPEAQALLAVLVAADTQEFLLALAQALHLSLPVPVAVQLRTQLY